VSFAPGVKRLPAFGKDLVRRRMRREAIPFLLVCTDFAMWRDYRDRVVIGADAEVADLDLRLVMDLHVLLCLRQEDRPERVKALLNALLDAEPRSLTVFAPQADNVFPIGRLGGVQLVTLPQVDAEASAIYRALLDAYA
jgi:hypothetical protein